MTATLPSEKEKAKEICDNLHIRSLAERSDSSPDVKPYIQDEEAFKNLSEDTDFINDLKNRFTINIDEVEIIKENVVFKIPKKLN